MHRIVAIALTLGLLALAGAIHQAQAAETVRVITDRNESSLKPLFRHFTETTGIEVEAVYVDEDLLWSRIEAQPTEADLIYTEAAEVLEEARLAGILAPFSSTTLDSVAPEYRDPDNMYLTVAYRARGIYISKDRIEPGEISTYMDLTKPEYQGRIAIRSGYHDYNIGLFCQMAATHGIDYAEKFITGIKANLARTPTGNDRAQTQAIYEDLADASIGNSYYRARMLKRDDQRAWALAVQYVFPDQELEGTYILRDAVGLTKADRNAEGATKLMEYLVGDFAQLYLANELNVYSINPKIPVSQSNRELGSQQPGIEDGHFKAQFLPLREINSHRDAVVEILNTVNFDQ